jgi:TRAP-type C4-dicarboxylate transport system permease small subunit
VWSRYVLQATFQWYDEVARLCFVWMVFLGAASAVRRGAHFRLHLLIDRLGPGLRRATDLVVGLLVVAFGGVLVAGGLAMWPVARRQVSDSLELSMVWFYAALPIGGALMILFSLPHLWRLARGR